MCSTVFCGILVGTQGALLMMPTYLQKNYSIYIDNMYKFDKINKESLTKLYSKYGFRLKEIGLMVGVSEDAIFKRIKQYDIPTNPRGKERLDIEVLFTGKKKDKKKTLSNEELLRLCKIGYTDAAIGEMFNMTGEGIAYRRKKYDIPLSIKANETKDNIEKLKRASKAVLERDYYGLNQEEFSKKYKISKVVWRPYLKSIDIIGKEIHRIEKYPPFNREQRSLIIGSLLGDGSVSQGTRFYESHSNKQKLYLLKKFNILRPYSSQMYPCDNDTGTKFITTHHPNFLEFYNEFYQKGLKGKLIPVEFIKNNWHDDILAYWFFDDGYYDDVNNEIFLSNLCPKKEQLEVFLDFLNKKFGWGFKYSFFKNIYNVTFFKGYYKNFIDMILKVATPDMYYKIPERYLTQDMASKIIYDEIYAIKPKFYRLASSEYKLKMEVLLFNNYRKRGFPYSKITLKRQVYLFHCFKKVNIKIESNNVIHNNTGVKLCEYFFPNIFECNRKRHRSPIEQWQEDKNLQRLIKNRLNYADRLTDSSLRTGIKLLFNAVTNFKPVIAKFLYQEYAPNGKIFDYSCGFGSRMLAAMSLDMEYIGCEPNLKTLSNLHKFGSFLSERTEGKFFITEKGSEDYLYRENYFDLAFSSPPFFDYEIYSQDAGQSVVKYSKYEDWLIGYWKRTIENCCKCLVPGGHFGVCISLNQHEHMIMKTREYCTELGLSFVAEYRAPYKQLLLGKKDKYDLILIYIKV